MACFNDKKLYEEAKILRGWGRSSATFNESEDIKEGSQQKYPGYLMMVNIFFKDGL